MTAAADSTSGMAPPAAPPNWRIVAPAGVLFTLGALYLGESVAARQGFLLLLGGLLGLVLYHATFGFAGSWRAFLAEGRGAGLRAQMLMLAVATVIFLPLLAEGSVLGQRVSGAVAPAGVSVLVGAFVFGIGMQLGGGCASGTLYGVGGGSPRMIVTLVFFILGSLIGTAHLPWWLELPKPAGLALTQVLGLLPAIALQLLLFLAIALLTVVLEKRRTGRLEGLAGTAIPKPTLLRRLLYGPWPLVWGAVALAVLNGVTLVAAGHPWTISFGYALWGAELASGLGVDVASWEFWTWPFPHRALEGGVFANTTSVMNFGVLLGAFLAAGLAGGFRPQWRIPWPSLLAAALGGLLMGYGARLAFGCNVGAYFSGIASGSLHGWLWLAAGMAGSYVGLRLRPLFGLSNVRLRGTAA